MKQTKLHVDTNLYESCNHSNFSQNLTSPLSASVLSFSPNQHMIISDTGATGIYLPTSQKHLLTTINKNHKPIKITLPDGSTLQSSASGKIQLGNIPSEALKAYIVPRLQQGLLGIAQLCDENLIVTYTKTNITITDTANKILLQHPRTSTLWTIPVNNPNLPPPPGFPAHTAFIAQPTFTNEHFANNAYPKGITNASIMLFWQRTFCSPTKSTFVRAAMNPSFQRAFPIPTSTFIRAYYVDTVATAKDHLNRRRQGLQSTKVPPKPQPTPPPQQINTKNIFVHVFKPTSTNYTDAIGNLPLSTDHVLIMYN